MGLVPPLPPPPPPLFRTLSKLGLLLSLLEGLTILPIRSLSIYFLFCNLLMNVSILYKPETAVIFVASQTTRQFAVANEQQYKSPDSLEQQNSAYVDMCLEYHPWSHLRSPWAVSRVGRKGATKVSSSRLFSRPNWLPKGFPGCCGVRGVCDWHTSSFCRKRSNRYYTFGGIGFVNLSLSKQELF